MTDWTPLDRRTVAVAALVMAGMSVTAGVPIGIGIAGGSSVGIALLRQGTDDAGASALEPFATAVAAYLTDYAWS